MVAGISMAGTSRATRAPAVPAHAVTPATSPGPTPTTVQSVPITVWQADGTSRRQMGTVTITSLPDKPDVPDP